MPETLSIERLKRLAKQHKKATACTHAEALDHIAKRYGYQTWAKLMEKQNA